ncbi:SMI1/KNR4 family protein [Pseudomonas sp. PDM16]|uniref:SMI1/KNR4 family protein n=1 Tax=Pseudomonas sp. PDM16 TaxID=2769292 RepID=UPI00177F115D|nr:SMI1/KNR4 family protein [Pseudomonas sp. PDM16]MBD9416997.1 SMI1/KNR4 family protein [Pseudomonas sp. PDM16]
MNLRDLLSQPDRTWHFKPGATADEIEALVTRSPVELPDRLLELLATSNGGEGELAAEPLWFCLDPVREIIESISDSFLAEFFPGYFFFGGNGGMERIALDVRSGVPREVVMIDPIAGPSSAVPIAPSFNEFVQAIGVTSDDSENDA